ncbi:MAG: Flp pilus assembly complex ATPase component TadA [Candidatus Omnitrophica bacterium]|nr:Flp pilus assembly complex ATPase component TadA [Candidatus Omnitrophota bacterium]
MAEGLQERWLGKLVDGGLLTAEQKETVLREAKANHVSILEIIQKKKFVTERELILFLSAEMNIPVMNPLNYKIAPEILELFPIEIVKRYRIVPISRMDRTLTVATSNPLGLMEWDDLAAITRLKIKPVLAAESLIDEAIRKFYPQAEPQEDTRTSEEHMAEVVKDMEMIAMGQLGQKNEAVDLGKELNEAPVIKITNLIVLESVKRKASDLFIEPWEKHVRVRCRVDGLLEEVKVLPAYMAQPVVSRIKVMSHLDIAEHRMPQDGRFKAKVQNREVDFRVSIIPTSFGEKVCIRLLDKKSQGNSLENLGFTGNEIRVIREAATQPHGMILITGPTGSGKTTTLYSILSILHTPDKNITTVEDPVEYQVHGINQVNVREGVGLTFAAALRSILRQDPNVVMIGEIRDLETMDIAIKAALTGHLVLSTLHTNDAAGSVVRMVNMGIEPFLIASSVRIVTAQRLIRRLCSTCKEPVEADPETLRILRRTSAQGLKIYRAKGCNSCRNSGFAGRRVITEVLTVSPAVHDLILKRANADVIKQVARKEGMTTLRESGLEKVLAGETTVEEVLRITAEDMEPAKC